MRRNIYNRQGFSRCIPLPLHHTWQHHFDNKTPASWNQWILPLLRQVSLWRLVSQSSFSSVPVLAAVTTGHSGAEQGPPDDEIPATSVVILEQKPFDKGSKKCPGIPPVQYDNYNLKSALERDYAELDNHSGQAFPPNASFAQKVSVRLQVCLLSLSEKNTRRSQAHLGSLQDIKPSAVRRIFCE